MTLAVDDAIHLARPPRQPTRRPPAEAWRRKLTVAEFMQMVEAGIISGRVELVDGEMIEMAAQGNGHSVGVSNSVAELGPNWTKPKFIRIEATHRFTEHLAYEPDLALLEQAPVPGALIDVVPRLIIEISDTTLARDLGEKRLAYARCGVPEYWVGDLRRRRMLTFRGPDLDATGAELAWAEERIFEADQEVEPLAIPGLRLKVADLLPAAGADPG